jgi:hypothetical protein
MNATINMSRAGLSHVARTSAAVLAVLDISGTCIDTYSSVNGHVEPGARIELFDTSPEDVKLAWESLRAEFGLHCAWLVTDDYAGCILEYI